MRRDNVMVVETLIAALLEFMNSLPPEKQKAFFTIEEAKQIRIQVVRLNGTGRRGNVSRQFKTEVVQRENGIATNDYTVIWYRDTLVPFTCLCEGYERLPFCVWFQRQLVSAGWLAETTASHAKRSADMISHDSFLAKRQKYDLTDDPPKGQARAPAPGCRR